MLEVNAISFNSQQSLDNQADFDSAKGDVSAEALRAAGRCALEGARAT